MPITTKAPLSKPFKCGGPTAAPQCDCESAGDPDPDIPTDWVIPGAKCEGNYLMRSLVRRIWPTRFDRVRCLHYSMWMHTKDVLL